MFDLTHKVALITGASRGLGWAMAESLARAGDHVVLNARDAPALSGRVAELQAQGLSGEAAAFDVNDTAAAQRCVADITTRLGRFDILVANAGINHRTPISGFALEDIQRVMNTNLPLSARSRVRVQYPASISSLSSDHTPSPQWPNAVRCARRSLSVLRKRIEARLKRLFSVLIPYRQEKSTERFH